MKQTNPRSPEEQQAPSNLQKDPDEWVTGDEPMTGAQASYLKTLSAEAGEAFDAQLSKAEASKRIDELQHKTGRGVDARGSAREQNVDARGSAREQHLENRQKGAEQS